LSRVFLENYKNLCGVLPKGKKLTFYGLIATRGSWRVYRRRLINFKRRNFLAKLCLPGSGRANHPSYGNINEARGNSFAPRAEHPKQPPPP